MNLIEVIAWALYDNNCGGTSDLILQDMAVAVCKADAKAALKAIEDAGYKLIHEDRLKKMADKHEISVSELLDV